MDVTISQFILEEFDVNCSLLDRLQETFLESSSIPFLGFDGPYCNATTDQIGTCWPRTSAGELVERPCPEFFNGIKYNTTISMHVVYGIQDKMRQVVRITTDELIKGFGWTYPGLVSILSTVML